MYRPLLHGSYFCVVQNSRCNVRRALRRQSPEIVLGKTTQQDRWPFSKLDPKQFFLGNLKCKSSVFLYFGLWLLLKDVQRPVRWKSRPDGRCNACDPCGKRVWVLWLQPCNDGALGTSGVVSCGCCFSHAVRGISQWGHLTGTSLMQDATVHPSHGGSEGTQTSIHCKVSETQ